MGNKQKRRNILNDFREMFATRRDAEISIGIILAFALIIGGVMYSRLDPVGMFVEGGVLGWMIAYCRQVYIMGLRSRKASQEMWYWTICADGRTVGAITDIDFAKLKLEVYQSRKNYLLSLVMTLLRSFNYTASLLPTIAVIAAIEGCLIMPNEIMSFLTNLQSLSADSLQEYASLLAFKIVPYICLIIVPILVWRGEHYSAFSINTADLIKARFNITHSMNVTFQRVVDGTLVQNDESEYLRQIMNPGYKPKSAQAGHLPTGEKVDTSMCQ